ncbi:MAG: hypothetical protein RLZZ156_1119 [Deinococcota bacterium]
MNNTDALRLLEFSRNQQKSPPKGLDYKKLPFAWVARAIAVGRSTQTSLRYWGKYASVEALIRIAQDIPKIENPDKLARAIAVFSERPFPLDYTLLLELCRHENEKVVWQAALALSWFSDPRIRVLAFEFLANPDTAREGLYLLELNFQEQDWEFLGQLTFEISDDRCEELTVRICEIAKTNPSVQAQKTLLQLYEAGSCASCRGYIIEKLQDLNCFPDWVLEEMLLDSYDYNREKAQAWAASQLEQK